MWTGKELFDLLLNGKNSSCQRQSSLSSKKNKWRRNTFEMEWQLKGEQET